MIFECLVNNKKLREIERFFAKMIKNECHPHLLIVLSHATLEIWSYMVETPVGVLNVSANTFLIDFCKYIV